MRVLARIGGPIVRALTAVTTFVMRLFGITGNAAESGLTEDEIRAVISEGAETGVLEAAEESIVQRVFQLGDQRVAAIMTPRVDIEWVDADITHEQLREFLASHSHTEFVVCHENLDNVLGTVRSAELLPAILRGGKIDLRSLAARRAVRARLDARLQAARSLSLIAPSCRDRDGRVRRGRRAGEVGDLLEGLVGALPADASEAQGTFVARGDGSWLVEGFAPMDEVTTRLEVDVPEGESRRVSHDRRAS